MKIAFSEYVKDDLFDVLEMMESFNKIDDYDFDRAAAEKNIVQFTSDKSLGKLYLIRLEKQNIGYIILTFGFSFEYKGRDAFIDEFFIRSDFRNMGIGRQTMEFIERESKKHEVRTIHLEVEAHNLNANKLYDSQGFHSTDRKLMTKRV